jgi:hypothetical protein
MTRLAALRAQIAAKSYGEPDGILTLLLEHLRELEERVEKLERRARAKGER